MTVINLYKSPNGKSWSMLEIGLSVQMMKHYTMHHDDFVT